MIQNLNGSLVELHLEFEKLNYMSSRIPLVAVRICRSNNV